MDDALTLPLPKKEAARTGCPTAEPSRQVRCRGWFIASAKVRHYTQTPIELLMKAGSMPQSHLGSCLCGTVRYELRSKIRAVSHCHCGICQKAHGAAFATYGSVPFADFVITHGDALLRRRESSPGVTRTFCSACGSPLTWHSIHGESAHWISFSLGTLDTPFSPLKHKKLHLASKASWYAADDEIHMPAAEP